MLVETPAAYLKDASTLAIAGTYEAQVLFEAPTETILDGRVETKRYAILYPANALGALQWQSRLTIGGVSYSVLTVRDLDDGMWQRADLEATG